MANKHNKAKALSILGQKLARAVYFMLSRNIPFNKAQFFNLQGNCQLG